MGQALYRKYRSKSFADVVGQKHITDTLQNAIKTGRISHAYLFTGPRGVGKTSVARILAHEVNGLPYTDESAHLDIIEIDAASNRRIDEIRELRDKIHITPTSAKYKVYIIDEVHMLTREAFNALLKTLEEPPAHCIFILATTEAHKLPETIISRTQRFEFKGIRPDGAGRWLASIAKKEKIDIDEEALSLLVGHGQGSFRDSISLLDQLSTAHQQITGSRVRDFLGLPSSQLISSILSTIESGQTAGTMNHMSNATAQGVDSGLLAQQLARQLRDRLVAGDHSSWIPKLLKDLLEVPASSSPSDLLEIAALEASLANIHRDNQITQPPDTAVAEAGTTPATPKKQPAAHSKAVAPKHSPIDEANWEKIVEKVKDQAASLYTALRLATPDFNNGKLTLAFQFPLHQKKIEQADNKRLIGKIVAEVTGQEVPVTATLDKSTGKPEPDKSSPAKVKADNSELKTISNIFGSPEVLESGK